MVAGKRSDAAAVSTFVADANIVIAHNANFDRKFAERNWPEFEHQHWACSATEIDWRAHGFEGSRHRYLLKIGFSRMARAATNARCGRRLMTSVYPSRMLAFTLIPGHLGNVG